MQYHFRHCGVGMQHDANMDQVSKYVQQNLHCGISSIEPPTNLFQFTTFIHSCVE